MARRCNIRDYACLKPGQHLGKAIFAAKMLNEYNMDAPKEDLEKAQSESAKYMLEAIQVLVEVMRESRRPQARIMAANALLNRAVGLPTKYVEHSGNSPIPPGAIFHVTVNGQPIEPVRLDYDGSIEHQSQSASETALLSGE